ncbi:phage replisome organizer N-terminal domain-containing protein [Clostridium sp. BNL1100]|uniref:phage replisome organizer N-terminal domain-containing protein n=1 Tax=Clostridium sp. BNL1100 TaxID=755731 RepID=UPI00024A7F2D|nr:phage replisome organizer N-terminal domain-containing protein [Clostridium sp. BNL1100]AEY65830.1 putative phage replisome organizer [Clostridium sp. BNL1100]
MSDNKKYYYLKVKENFFDSEEMIILESMPDGYLYSNILLKLYLRSLKNEGKLMFNDRIPYNSTILSQVVRHPVGVVEKAIQIFKDFGLIDILNNGAIYMLDIQNYIGQSSTEADRQRDYQKRIAQDKGILPLPECKKSNRKSNKKSDNKSNRKTTPEIELEIEKDIDIELKKKSKTALESAIDDFKDYRKKIRKPMTDRAVQLLIIELNKLASDDETKIQILNQSIVNGWQGVFELKKKNEGTVSNATVKEFPVFDKSKFLAK